MSGRLPRRAPVDLGTRGRRTPRAPADLGPRGKKGWRDAWRDPVSAEWTAVEVRVLELWCGLLDKPRPTAAETNALQVIPDKLRLTAYGKRINGDAAPEPEPDPEDEDDRREFALRMRLPFAGLDPERVSRLHLQAFGERITPAEVRRLQADARARIESEGLENQPGFGRSPWERGL